MRIRFMGKSVSVLRFLGTPQARRESLLEGVSAARAPGGRFPIAEGDLSALEGLLRIAQEFDELRARADLDISSMEPASAEVATLLLQARRSLARVNLV